MKKKLIIIGSLIVLLVFGFIYSQKSSLIADDKDGKKDCSSSCTKTGSAETKTGCTEKNMSGANTSDDKNGYAVYEFVTDKIHCDGCKSGVSSQLMGISGVKEVEYSETCKVSHMTSVKVFFNSSETTPEIISASVKEKKLEGNCPDGSKCESKKSSEKKL